MAIAAVGLLTLTLAMHTQDLAFDGVVYQEENVADGIKVAHDLAVRATLGPNPQG